MGCQSSGAITDDSAYRSVERQANQNITDIAVTGERIVADTERIEKHADTVQSAIDGIQKAITTAVIPAAEKRILLNHTTSAQDATEALIRETDVLRKDVEKLNNQLTEQREINTALAEAHDEREATMARELDTTRKALVREKAKSTRYLVILIVVFASIMGAFVLKYRGIIP
jgi:hypothetical protein